MDVNVLDYVLANGGTPLTHVAGGTEYDFTLFYSGTGSIDSSNSITVPSGIVGDVRPGMTLYRNYPSDTDPAHPTKYGYVIDSITPGSGTDAITVKGSPEWATESSVSWRISTTGSIISGSQDTLYQPGMFSGVTDNSDTLWIQSGANMSTYTITSHTDDTATVDGQDWDVAENVRWKVTKGPLSACDCTLGFQSAMDDVSASGGGVVYVPANYNPDTDPTTVNYLTGYYYFADFLTIPPNVILRGMWTKPPVWIDSYWFKGLVNDGSSYPSQGPVLCPTYGKDDDGIDDGGTMEPFITLVEPSGSGGRAGNSGIEGLTIYYPLQGIVSGSGTAAVEVVQYPYCIKCNWINPNVMNMLLVNPYQGIRMTPQTGGQISSVIGCPLKQGILVDQTSDFSIFEKIEFHPQFYTWLGKDVFAKDIEHR